MKVIFYIILVFIIGLSYNSYSQTRYSVDNSATYIEEYENAKRLISKKEYTKAENILLSLKKNDNLSCDLKSEISNLLGVCKYFQKDKISAFKIWQEETLPLRMSCDSINPERTAQTLYNIGVVYGLFYDYKNAIKSINKAIELLKNHNLLKWKKYVDFYLNQYYNSSKLRDYNTAQGFAFKALSLYDSLKINDLGIRGEIYSTIGRNFIDKNEFPLSNEFLDKAKIDLEKTQSSKLGSLYRNYALYYRSINDYKESFKWGKKALEFVENNHIKNKMAKALIFETLGMTSVSMGEYRKALMYYFKSLNERKINNAEKSSMSNIYENIAGAYGRMGMLDSALYYIDLSIAKTHSLDNINELSKYEELRENDFNKSDMVRKLQMKGKFLNRKYSIGENIEYLIESEKSFSIADSLVNLQRREIMDNDSKVLLGSSLDTIYKYAIENAFLLWETTGEDKYLQRAYRYVGENKAQVFSETKEELDAVWEILDADLRQKYLKVSNDLKSNLFQKQYAVLKDDSLAYQMLNAEYLNLSIEKEKIFNEIKYNYPDFYQRIYGNIDAKTIDDLQKKLDDDNAILEYYIDGKTLFTFIITKHNYTAIKQEVDMDLDSIFNVFANDLTLFSNIDSNLELSKKIYPLLFPDKLIKSLEKNKINRLIVIRDKNLNKVPFGAIMTGADLRKDYLIFDFAFSYSFNNKHIWDLKEIKKEKEYEFEGFATNYDAETLNQITKDTIFWIGSFPPTLKPLKLSVEEVKSISEMFSSKVWVKEEANYENFISNANRSKILHLSLHSLIASNNNEQNGMIFQKTNKNSKFILKSSDLIGLRLDNSLSVLSSCYSSDGSVVTGEGINSLARSFSLAGSPSIIASQWQSYEGQSKDILNLFYRFLKDGNPKDIALQKAKQKYIGLVDDKYISPANWANLVLLGDPSAIHFERSNWWYIGIFVFVLLILLISLAKKKRV